MIALSNFNGTSALKMRTSSEINRLYWLARCDAIIDVMHNNINDVNKLAYHCNAYITTLHMVQYWSK
jgi:hypothetical protein